jgi:hypothetical protein
MSSSESSSLAAPRGIDQEKKVTYVALTFAAVLSSFFFHELAHYSMGRGLGYDMVMTLNSSYARDIGVSIGDAVLIDAAGPLFTIVEAIAIYVLLRRGASPKLYPWLFVSFYMRALALGISFLNPNDEARISAALGLGMWTLPIIVTAFLFSLVWSYSQRVRLPRRLQATVVISTLVFSSLLIGLDRFLK